MGFLPFFCAKNLLEPTLSEGQPWDFIVPDEQNSLKKIAKEKRRTTLLRKDTTWNVYSAIRGLAKNQRISKSNPPSAAHGLVLDYDMVSNIDSVMGYVEQMPENLRPNFIEISLSNKIRLIWIFERPVLTPTTQFCIELLERLVAKLNVEHLLPGYDKNSTKPTEMWTNGGTWYDVRPEPLAWDFCFGVVCDVSKKSSLFANGEISLESISAEVQKRFPGRWKNDFKLDALGVRFWDETADNPSGCQVKPDGMLCFTGNEPFVKWEQIFGRPWCEEQRVLNLGRAGEDIYFDGKNYWEPNQNRWETVCRADIILRLKGRGLSDKTAKGQTQSDLERVLDHIQQVNRIQGAAPLIYHPPGLVELPTGRVLNISDLRPVQPIIGSGDPRKDFPWLWDFLNGFFPRPELKPLDYFLAWLRRSYRVVLHHKPFMGQAVFICGPRNNGKTLLILRIVAPLMGHRVANPLDYLKGDTQFNSELFSAALLAVNDDDAPSSETQRRRMLSKLKGFVVNPIHKYAAKFEKPVTIDWQGRIMVSLNDDPGSVGMLLEVENNTRDKQIYFASQPYKKAFPPQDELEAIIARELPYFAHWLLEIYQPPAEVLSDDRMGINSYFDPKILELSHQQTFASNLGELIQVWIKTDAFWGENVGEWTGTPTDLLTCFQTCDATVGVAREWTQQKIAKSLTALAKQDGSHVNFIGDSGRDFSIKKP